MQQESYNVEEEKKPLYVDYLTEEQVLKMSFKEILRKLSNLNLLHELDLIKLERRKLKSRIYSKKSRSKTIKEINDLEKERNSLIFEKNNLEREIKLLIEFGASKLH